MHTPRRLSAAAFRAGRRRTLLVLAAIFATAPPALHAHPQPAAAQRQELHVVAFRTSAPIKVDGVLDEADWERTAVATGFIQNEPREGQPASEETEVRVMYDDAMLYVGVFAHDRDPGAIAVTDLREDFAGGISNASTDTDLFELVLDTFGDKRNGYQFAVNAAGAKADAQMANEGRETNWSWDGVWIARARITDAGWYAEIAVPFKTLKFASTDQQTWGVNFHRKIRRRNEDSFWSPLPRIFNLSRVSLAGSLDGLQNLQPGRDLRLKPYGLTSYSKTLGSGTKDANAGFDVKYGVGSGLTWDFTVRTDFAQVEADEQVVNLSRFSVFFPEKRDFFIENSGVFGFGVAQTQAGGGGGGGRSDTAARNDVILFYSRQIGLSQTFDAIPIVAGTRLTGRVGRYSVGALNIQQEALGVTPATNFTALRLRRDLFANSDVGVMVLSKEANGPAFNRVVGADGNFRFFQNLNINGNLTKTFASSGVLAAGSGGDTMVNAKSTYRGRIWDFRGSYTNVGPRFRDEMGYVPRIGITKTQAFISPHMRFQRTSSWLRDFWPHWEFSDVKRADGATDSRYYDYHVPLSFQNGGFIEAGVNRSIEGPATPFRINARTGVVIPAGAYAFNDYLVTARTNQGARFFASGTYNVGDFYDGYRHVYQAGLGTRFNEHLNVSGTYSRNVVSLPGGAFTTNLLSTRVIYGFSTRMFVNALIQYNTDARQWTSNIRFNLIHRPLSDFFLVYNEQRDTLTQALLGRTLIAKVTYMMAF
jgi:hypothetical protein